MKKIGYSAVPVIIRSGAQLPPPPNGGHHDPWLSHAVGGVVSGVHEHCSSGNYVGAFVFDLVDGIAWTYPFILADFDTSLVIVDNLFFAQFVGETWNFGYRGMVFDKVAPADWSNWKLGH